MTEPRMSLDSFAQKLRDKPTRGEAKLLPLLTRIGFEFQVVIGRFVADFVRDSLIVEIDGLSHVGKESQDEYRERSLIILGYQFIRFPDSFAVEFPEKVLAIIEAHIAYQDRLREIQCPEILTKDVWRYAQRETFLTSAQLRRAAKEFGWDLSALDRKKVKL